MNYYEYTILYYYSTITLLWVLALNLKATDENTSLDETKAMGRLQIRSMQR